MAEVAVFTVTNPEAPFTAVDQNIGAIAAALSAAASAESPRDTGTLAGGYRTVRNGPAAYAVINDVSYWRFVEFGTSRQAPQPALGRALAVFRARYGGV
jgi:HK97 gp10 family phage protein